MFHEMVLKLSMAMAPFEVVFPSALHVGSWAQQCQQAGHSKRHMHVI
jgi:hypothetical protein